MKKLSPLLRYSIISLAIIGADRISKAWIMTHERLYVHECFNFEASLNRGFSWSVFSSQNTTVFMLVSFIAFLFFLVFLCYTAYRYKNNFSIMPEICILSGALSNLIDRFIYYGVVDFITVSCGQWAWPAFNIADAAICIGSLWMIAHILRHKQ